MSDETPQDTTPDDPHGTMEAWGLIANAHEGDWSKATDEWRAAAERWRDRWRGVPSVSDEGEQP